MINRLTICRFGILTIVLCLLSSSGKAQDNVPRSDTFDDVMQYVPYAAVITLKGAGVESKGSWPQLLTAVASSYLVTAGTTYILKHTIHHTRPDGSDRRSFPSGHAAISFAGAQTLHRQYGHLSPWISVGGYVVATATAIDRVARDRHHWYDVAAGAAIGVASAELGHWLSKKLFPNQSACTVNISPMGLNVMLNIK